MRLYREQFLPHGDAAVQAAQPPFDPHADLLRFYSEQFMAHTGLDRSQAFKPVK